MTTELTEPQTELGPVPVIGQGQQQGHRRRRRRRKNKSSQTGVAQAPQPQSPQQELQPPPQAPPQPHARAPKPASAKQAGQQAGHRGGHQGGHQSQGRKKKFPQKAPAAQAQPGNSISGPPQAKRKMRQQKGPREFVGPMDHSYRLVNGNVADGPPSTIEISSNGHAGGAYQDAYEPQPAAAIRADAPTRDRKSVV